MRVRFRAPSGLLALALCGACRDGQPDDGFVARHRAIVAAERVVVCTGEDARAFLESRLPADYVLATSLDAEPDVPRVVFAGPGTPGIEALLAAVGVEPRENGFAFDGRFYLFGDPDEPSDAIALTVPDPDRPGRPLNLAYARTPLDAARIVGDVRPAARSGFRTWRKGAVERAGPLRADLGVDAARVRELAEARARSLAGSLRVQAAGFAWRLPDARDRPEWRAFLAEHALVRALQAARQRARALLTRLDEPAIRDDLVLCAWDDPASKAAATGNWNDAWSNPVDGGVHLVLPGPDAHPTTAAAWIGAAAAAWARSAARVELGPPALPWLADGFALDAAGRFADRALGAWQARLTATLIAGERDLGDAAALALAGERSPLLVRPLRAALFRLLLDERGPEHVRALWRGEVPFALDDELAGRFAVALEASARRHASALDAERERRDAVLAAAPGLGVHVEPERFGVDDPERGHGSPGVRASLEGARELGLGSITVSAYRYVEPGPPERFGDAGGPPAPVPDAALARTLAIARELGLRTALRSNALRGPSTTWSAWMPLAGVPAWTRALDGLERVVEHHALLAELAGCDLLCVAGALRNATDTALEREGREPEDAPVCALKLAAWRRIARIARAAFDGGLTYAAEDPGELYNVEFWDALDYVGLDLYAPRSDPNAPLARAGRAVVEHRFRVDLARLGEVGARVGRPVLVTDVGFASAARSFADPTWPSGPVDVDLQSEELTAFARAARELESEAGVPLAGAWLWRWSTDPDAGGNGDRGWLLARKPAEALVPDLARALR